MIEDLFNVRLKNIKGCLMSVSRTFHNNISPWPGLDSLHYYGSKNSSDNWEREREIYRDITRLFGKKMGCGVPKLIMLDCSTSTQSTVKTVLRILWKKHHSITAILQAQTRLSKRLSYTGQIHKKTVEELPTMLMSPSYMLHPGIASNG